MKTQAEARKIRKVLLENMSADKIVAKADGSLEFYHSYFYRHGNTAEKWETAVVKKVSEMGYNVEYSESEDRYASWPKDSYFVARIVLK